MRGLIELNRLIHTRNRISRIITVLLVFFHSVHSQEVFFPERRVSYRDFVVMAWGRAPRDPKHLQLMKDAGINVAGFARVEDLEQINKAGLKAFLADDRTSGYDFGKPIDETSVRRNVDSLVREVGSHPAVIGFNVFDEPNLKAVKNVGIVSRIVLERGGGKWPYVNLFPIHARAEYLGTTDYSEYVRSFIETNNPPFVSYDNYSLLNGFMNDTFFMNLEIIRKSSIEAGIPFWNCVLATAHRNFMENTDATFHLQAYATMAYGGRGIQYYNYIAEPRPEYRSAPIDQWGNKTSSWDMLRRINNQIHALAPTLKSLKSTGVYHYPDVPPHGKNLSESKLVKSIEMTQRVVPQAQARFFVGEFMDDTGRQYFMLVNKDLKESFSFKIQLHDPKKKLIHISPFSGEEEGVRSDLDWVAPGAGHLFRVE